MKLQRRLTIAFAAIVLLAALVSIGVYYVYQTRLQEASIRESLDLGERALRSFTREQSQRARYLVNILSLSPTVQSTLLGGPDPALGREMNAYLEAFEAHNIDIIDIGGVTLLGRESFYAAGSAPDGPAALDRSGAPSFLDSDYRSMLADGEISGLRVCGVTRLCTTVLAPIADGGGAVIGAVRIGYRIDDEFAERIREIAGLEAALLRHGGVPALSSGLERESVLELMADHEPGSAADRREFVCRLDGNPCRVRIIELDDARGQPIGAAMLALPLDEFIRLRTSAALAFVLSALGVALLALIMAGISARKMVQPISDLAARTGRLARGDYDPTPPAPGSDIAEIRDLSNAFDTMAAALQERERTLRESLDQLSESRAEVELKAEELREANIQLKERQQQIIQSGRLAAVGELAAGMAHEIGNPLGAISGYAQLSLRQLEAGRFDDQDIKADLEQIVRKTDFIRGIIGDLLDFSRTDKAEAEKVDVARALEEALAVARLHKAFSASECELHMTPNLPAVRFGRKELIQVMLNLLINAAQSMDQGGKVTVEAVALDRVALVSVTDRGSGIPDEIKEKIFDPFFTTKAPGVGTGLGLSVSYRILEKYGGDIIVESRPGQGSTFSLVLPAAD